MKRTISTDEVADSKRRLQKALAIAKAETAKAQESFNVASVRLEKAKTAQAGIEGAIKALEGLG